ncbi:MAG: hypothetical protein ACKOPU_05070 [Candidatus Planktophila sp.]
MDKGRFNDTLVDWADAISKYEQETTLKLSDDVKIAVLMSKTKGQFARAPSIDRSFTD